MALQIPLHFLAQLRRSLTKPLSTSRTQPSSSLSAAATTSAFAATAVHVVPDQQPPLPTMSEAGMPEAAAHAPHQASGEGSCSVRPRRRKKRSQDAASASKTMFNSSNGNAHSRDSSNPSVSCVGPSDIQSSSHPEAAGLPDTAAAVDTRPLAAGDNAEAVLATVLPVAGNGDQVEVAQRMPSIPGKARSQTGHPRSCATPDLECAECEATAPCLVVPVCPLCPEAWMVAYHSLWAV